MSVLLVQAALKGKWVNQGTVQGAGHIVVLLEQGEVDAH
jgi:hypothetical protein